MRRPRKRALRPPQTPCALRARLARNPRAFWPTAVLPRCSTASSGRTPGAAHAQASEALLTELATRRKALERKCLALIDLLRAADLTQRIDPSPWRAANGELAPAAPPPPADAPLSSRLPWLALDPAAAEQAHTEELVALLERCIAQIAKASQLRSTLEPLNARIADFERNVKAAELALDEIHEAER